MEAFHAMFLLVFSAVFSAAQCMSPAMKTKVAVWRYSPPLALCEVGTVACTIELKGEEWRFGISGTGNWDMGVKVSRVGKHKDKNFFNGCHGSRCARYNRDKREG